MLTVLGHAGIPDPQGILEQFWGGGQRPGSHPNPLPPSVQGTGIPPSLHLGRGHLWAEIRSDPHITLIIGMPQRDGDPAGRSALGEPPFPVI